MVEKRHLPVVSAPSPAQDAESPRRSNATWVALGTVLVVVLSMPLLMLGLWISGVLSRLAQSARVHVEPHAPLASQAVAALATVTPLIVAFAVAAYIGCFLIVRFGRLQHDLLASLVGALGGMCLASLTAAAEKTLSPWPLWAAIYALLVGVGALSGRIAGRLGRDSKKPATLNHVSPTGTASNRDENP